MKKFWVGFFAGFAFALLVFMGVGYFLAKRFDTVEESLSVPVPRNSKQESIVNFSMKLRDLKVDTIINENRFNKKIVFLNFWEYWCKPCKKELPSIQRLYNSVNDSTIVFAIISTENPDIVRKDKFVVESSLPFFSAETVMPSVFKGEQIPRTFLIDRKGNIIIKEIGAASWDDEKIIALIDSLKRAY
jgi:thiol-disulfide isomerase/thioredoxin